MDQHVRISADLGRHAVWLREDLEMGFEHLYLHNVGKNQREFIEAFGERVLPEL
jgi:coenzyme F420-dependent glucose-6-phosphate dehydrogenase